MSLRKRWMATLYDRVMRNYEPWIADRKRALFADVSGTVLELGPGTGANLPYLTDAARWIGIEPNRHMHARLQARVEAHGIAAEVRGVTAAGMDMADESVDVVVSTLVLCSVPDPAAVARDVVRVLRPGGRFLFIEHVGARRGTWLRRTQRAARPFTRFLADGCCPDRDLADVVRGADFGSVEIESFSVPREAIPRTSSPHIQGVGVR